MSYLNFAANQSPAPNQMAAYSQARQLQQRVRQAAGEMAALDGQPGDLDPAKDAVALSNGSIPSIQGSATGSVRFQDGKLVSLAVEGKDDSLQFSKLNAGATAYAGKGVVVVETADGGLRVNTMPYQGTQAAIEEMRPKGVGESAANGVRRTFLTALGAAAGAVPGLGAIVNFAVGSSGWAAGDQRVSMGLLGIGSNVVGALALGAKFVSIAGLSLAPVAGPVAIAALGLSALCAGGSSWIASDK